MSSENTVSNEQISALIDGQLSAEEQAMILRLAQGDEQLSRRIEQQRRLKETLVFAYKQKHPKEDFLMPVASTRWLSHVAALVLFVLGAVVGIASYTQLSENDPKTQLGQIALNMAVPEKMILQIASKDPERIKATLQDTEFLLRQGKFKNKQIQLEVIANADGLNMLSLASPYRERIAQIASNHENVRFLACGTGMSLLKRKGIDLKLIPEAELVSAVTAQVGMRLSQGWSYLRE